jgi:large subunit ribosomal protein L32
MAVPKRKVSKSRRDKRRASNFRISVPSVVECPHCHEKKIAHQVCKNCGYYDGQERIVVDKEKKD